MGTHVASAAVGTEVGVAKKAKVVAVRVLDSNGSGTISNTMRSVPGTAGNHWHSAEKALLSLTLLTTLWSVPGTAGNHWHS
eukprot:gene30743-35779_t